MKNKNITFGNYMYNWYMYTNILNMKSLQEMYV